MKFLEVKTNTVRDNNDISVTYDIEGALTAIDTTQQF